VIGYIIQGKGEPGHTPGIGIALLGGAIGAALGVIFNWFLEDMD
jgi:hypothetical protein